MLEAGLTARSHRHPGIRSRLLGEQLVNYGNDRDSGRFASATASRLAYIAHNKARNHSLLLCGKVLFHPRRFAIQFDSFFLVTSHSGRQTACLKVLKRLMDFLHCLEVFSTTDRAGP